MDHLGGGQAGLTAAVDYSVGWRYEVPAWAATITDGNNLEYCCHYQARGSSFDRGPSRSAPVLHYEHAKVK